ncbi:aminotransferase class V-fold PLP-dependent enzyme [Actinomadura scrupuli]|uniref:aminotransferase class V-fold PLP-dependent enzyme n=1 Tax=Actinomadura scrupuli TaxID=559629 RepID=UPI003D96D67A
MGESPALTPAGALDPLVPHDLLEDLRATEYGYLDADDHLYLDYTGAGLPADAQLRAHADRVRGRCFGNPHTGSPSSEASTELVEQTRAAVLAFFNADPQEYAVVFTANATAGCRLVGEAYPFRRGSRLVMTADNHNSVHGIREFARARRAAVEYVPAEPPELRADEARLRAALTRRRRGASLFVYPAQSNFTGVQHPLDWIGLAHEHGYDVLLDAAAFVPANRLDLSLVRPDFVPVSWYKVFGYPTGVGCLVARREALARLVRPWFAGGTVLAASTLGGWHVMAGDESAFEDGTLNFLAIPDVRTGLAWIDGIGVDVVHRHVTALTGRLLGELARLRHGDGTPMIRLYGPGHTGGRGGTVAFNILDARGDVVDERVVARDTAARRISIRTGCFCNPGAGEGAFALGHRALTGRVRTGARPLEDRLGLLGLPTVGAVRASLGVASNGTDVERFTAFLEETYRDRVPGAAGLPPRERC